MKAIETGDSSKINIASDAVDHNGGPQGRELKGDSIKWYLADMHNHFGDLKFVIINDASDGDYVYSYTRMTGTTKDASMGIPAGTKLDMKGVDVLKFKDGKLSEHWGYMDPNDMMKMMQASGIKHTDAGNPAKTDSTKK
ncbi:MAG TPA: ester cyclase [Flavisolibacter sp.]|nr:ester cyclase [Flavisolibacter sp.]